MVSIRGFLLKYEIQFKKAKKNRILQITLSKKQINYIAISLGLITVEKKKYALNIE